MTESIKWTVTGTDRMEKCSECDGNGVLVKNKRVSSYYDGHITHTHENHPCKKCSGTGKVNITQDGKSK